MGYETYLVDNIPIDENCKSGIIFPNQAIINPIKLINELSKQLNIYEHSEVETIKKDYAMLTNKSKVYFDKVIIATNYPIKNISGL